MTQAVNAIRKALRELVDAVEDSYDCESDAAVMKAHGYAKAVLDLTEETN